MNYICFHLFSLVFYTAEKHPINWHSTVSEERIHEGFHATKSTKKKKKETGRMQTEI
jgi:hypothetical protein